MASRVRTASCRKVTASGCPGRGNDSVGLLKVSSDSACSVKRTRMRTIGPRKTTSSTVPVIRLPSAESPGVTVSGRTAMDRTSPARAVSRPRAATISWPSTTIRPRAGSVTRPRRTFRVPMNEATKAVFGKL